MLSASTLVLISMWIVTRNIGYLLHPLIMAKLPHHPVIADVGTGTGLFLSQLASMYPNATLRGFDISRELYPSRESMPPNVSLDMMDVKSPPPLEEQNQYDVVHVRLLTAAMSPTDWSAVASNLKLLLRPGGALQWEECNFAQGRHLRGKTDSTISAARFVGSLFRETLREKLSYGWSTLPSIFKDLGLGNVEEDIVSSDRAADTREALTANGMVAVFDWAKLTSARGMLGSLSIDELEKLEEQAYQDIKSGCYVRFDIHVILGFESKRSASPG